MNRPNSDNPSSAQQLQQTLQRVYAELQVAPRVDEPARKLLREALADIERALGEPRASSAPPQDSAAHAPRLKRLAVAFEAEHPTVAGSLRQLIDLLEGGGL